MDSKTLKQFITQALKELTGDWVLLGGTLLPALGVDVRTTLDIDFVKAQDDSKTADTLKLMEIAEKLGLSVDAINQAGAFFLYRIPGYSKHLVVLAESRKSRVLRPTLDLYLTLKIKRLTESDLMDCLAMLEYAKASAPKELKLKLTPKAIAQALRERPSPNRESRLLALRAALQNAQK